MNLISSINKKNIVFSVIAIIGFSSFLISKSNNNQADRTTNPTVTARDNQSTPSHFDSSRPTELLQAEIKPTDTGETELLSQNSHSSHTDQHEAESSEVQLREEELAKSQQCHDSNIDEVGYITEAYNQNTLDSHSAIQQILHQMQTCNRSQVASIVQKIFNDSDDATHSMALLLDLLPQMDRALPVISAIKQQSFSSDQMKDLIALTKDQPTGIKAALIPSIVKNDNLEDFLSLTQQDNFFNSMEQRTGSYPSADQASNMIQSFIISERHNIKTEGDIYNYLLSNNPNPATLQQLTKIAFTQNP
ncbi:MAG: hypothetical protein OEY29_00460 [Gammaproteobacteria bacterium]|nr:hypothetical protein [Gammaproteobacteria bacterium]